MSIRLHLVAHFISGHGSSVHPKGMLYHYQKPHVKMPEDFFGKNAAFWENAYLLGNFRPSSCRKLYTVPT